MSGKAWDKTDDNLDAAARPQEPGCYLSFGMASGVMRVKCKRKLAYRRPKVPGKVINGENRASKFS